MKSIRIIVIGILVFLLMTVVGCRGKNTDGAIDEETIATYPIIANERLYVTAMNEDKVVAIDIEKGMVVSEQRVGSKPYGLAIDNDRNQLLVACALSHEVWFLDLDSFEILGKVEVGRIPAIIAINKDNARAYVSNSGADTVSVINLVTRQEIKQIVVGKSPYNVEVLDNTQLVVLNHDEATMVIVDLNTEQVVATYDALQKSAGLAIYHEEKLIFSGGHGANNEATDILIHDLSDASTIGYIDTKDMPAYLTIAGSYLHVLLHEAEELITYNIKQNYQEVVRLKTGKYPFAVVTIGSDTVVAVTNMDSNTVQIFDIAKKEVIETIAVPGGPVGMVYYGKK